MCPTPACAGWDPSLFPVPPAPVHAMRHRHLLVLFVLIVVAIPVSLRLDSDAAPPPVVELESIPEVGPQSGLAPPLVGAVFTPARTRIDAAEPEGSSASQGSGELSVVVFDGAGAELAGATVALQARGGVLSSQLSDASGTVRFSRLSQDAALELCVRAEGHETWVRELESPLPTEYEVNLAWGSSLAGGVIFPDGTTPGEGVRVLAWPLGYAPAATTATAVPGGAIPAGLRTALTDEHGRFVIDGLPSGGRWVVSAAGAGCLCRNKATLELPHGNEVLLDVQHAYLAAVRVESAGAPPRTSKELFGRGSGFSIKGHGAKFVPPVLVVTEMAALGLPLDLVLSERARNERLLLATSLEPRPDGVLVAYANHIPGYRLAWSELLAGPLRGDAPVYVIEVEQETEGFGALELRLSGGSLGLLGEILSDRPLGELRLTNTDTGEILNLNVPRSAGMTRRFESIPIGSYWARLNIYEGGMVFPHSDDPAMGVLIEEGHVETLDMKVEDAGSLCLLLMQPDNTEYAGFAYFNLVEAETRRLVSNVFERGPYVLEGLPAGEYELQFEGLPGFDEQAMGHQLVFVGENQAHYEEVRLVR